MAQKIPNHHVKQTICATRPAYREGRVPKAVKVYTINNESKYILIQGVPSVGATKELVQLCSSYGSLEEHRALDEYPSEDKYTDVYLVKYKKIQSARFAKRKLDDYSFFGGSLHVCYAPEYESIKDTREKLQERRRAVAIKIRHHSHKSEESSSSRQHDQTTPTFLPSQTERVDQNSQETSSSKELQSDFCNDRVPMPETALHSSHSQLQSESSNPLSYAVDINSSPHMSSEPHTFVLPPPPKPSLNKMQTPKVEYEYSRVPSNHSTLPVGFDGRLGHSNKEQQSAQSESTIQSSNKTEPSTSKAKDPSYVINKNYKPTKPALKFVPRQAVKRTVDESDLDFNEGSSDGVNNKIRKNAFILSDQQGPADLPGRRNDMPKLLLPPGASSSYNNTIKSIRNKISKVITDTMKSQK